ncbi:hypothetical protein [Embleya scabrispora]|uniref:hypothetical protein n=1 Tax=Embleya scabrispora TaxID=159449 RepID=UPI0003654768|nr:hypothetical protein [Embleya scabrispora]MYS80363.1 hypothetical protein [Streptomyces sp. SID5474]
MAVEALLKTGGDQVGPTLEGRVDEGADESGSPPDRPSAVADKQVTPPEFTAREPATGTLDQGRDIT